MVTLGVSSNRAAAAVTEYIVVPTQKISMGSLMQ